MAVFFHQYFISSLQVHLRLGDRVRTLGRRAAFKTRLEPSVYTRHTYTSVKTAPLKDSCNRTDPDDWDRAVFSDSHSFHLYIWYKHKELKFKLELKGI